MRARHRGLPLAVKLGPPVGVGVQAELEQEAVVVDVILGPYAMPGEHRLIGPQQPLQGDSARACGSVGLGLRQGLPQGQGA